MGWPSYAVLSEAPPHRARASGGLGAAEGSIAVLLVSTVGLASDLAVAATLLMRLCTLWFGVGVGLVALGLLLRRTEIGAEAA